MTRLEDWLFWKLFRRWCKRNSPEQIENLRQWMRNDVTVAKMREANRKKYGWLA